MANIDRNFIATPAFVVRSEGGGNTITMQVAGVVSGSNYTGWRKINFGMSGVVAALNYELSPYNVTPSVSNNDDLYFMSEDPDNSTTESPRQARVYNFLNFVHDNPVHVKSINLRASSDAVMPMQVIVKTPNIFTGQLDRQVIDVASKKTAYQYQNSIITISDVDFYLCRNSIIEFSGAFSAAAASTSLFVDLVIDTYLSLEKGLTENVTLLNTVSGQVVAAVEQTQNVEAVVNANTLNAEAVKRIEETVSYKPASSSAVAWLQEKTRR